MASAAGKRPFLVNGLIMLVIHPKDRTTAMLTALYEGTDARLIDQSRSNAEIKHLLNHVSSLERILLLGHGSDKGLFSRESEDDGLFDRLLIGHSHAYYLRRHGGNTVGVWCNADLFARKEGLHGLFSGMIITEMEEAAAYGVETTRAELDVESVKLARRLRQLMDEEVPLSDIPARLLLMDDAHSKLTTFNYRNFYYL